MAPACPCSRGRIGAAEARDDRSNGEFERRCLRELAWSLASLPSDQEIGERRVKRPSDRCNLFDFFDNASARERGAVACFGTQPRGKNIERGIEKDDERAPFATRASNEIGRARCSWRPATEGKHMRSFCERFPKHFGFRNTKRLFAEATEGFSSGGRAETSRSAFIEISQRRTESRRQRASKRRFAASAKPDEDEMFAGELVHALEVSAKSVHQCKKPNADKKDNTATCAVL